MSSGTGSAGLRLAFGILSVIPVRVDRVDRPVAGRAMACAPLVGLVLGGSAAGVLALAAWAGTGALTAAALAVATLALLTRGLHLDGLADTADGLGSAKPAPDALRIMKASDIGPFGVLSLLFLVLIEVGALVRLQQHGSGPAAAGLVLAAVTGRAALSLACRPGVPSARPDGLGAMVAGTVGRGVLLAWSLVLVATAGLYAVVQDPAEGLRALGAAGAGLAAGALLLRHTTRRFGGITGDVLGAVVEISGCVALLVVSTG
ncbi:adenosylcobinamide-GDP ribazoletransferase [Embleya scabrispora]|uniref:adenosylcobinamide-GDP ribazoletransferase n=1 Tax=Embleya scabrispora TaxID=159449 RepID=UPI0003688C8D|nr:adenosylcobinamide-GDP ribazoletransferase [Embleya scabrispora]MYS87113.1 adenosylcobinamide-GDP ribazoletransferase [Streptomyces sp. SID5474]